MLHANVAGASRRLKLYQLNFNQTKLHLKQEQQQQQQQLQQRRQVQKCYQQTSNFSNCDHPNLQNANLQISTTSTVIPFPIGIQSPRPTPIPTPTPIELPLSNVPINVLRAIQPNMFGNHHLENDLNSETESQSQSAICLHQVSADYLDDKPTTSRFSYVERKCYTNMMTLHGCDSTLQSYSSLANLHNMNTPPASTSPIAYGLTMNSTQETLVATKTATPATTVATLTDRLSSNSNRNYPANESEGNYSNSIRITHNNSNIVSGNNDRTTTLLSNSPTVTHFYTPTIKYCSSNKSTSTTHEYLNHHNNESSALSAVSHAIHCSNLLSPSYNRIPCIINSTTLTDCNAGLNGAVVGVGVGVGVHQEATNHHPSSCGIADCGDRVLDTNTSAGHITPNAVMSYSPSATPANLSLANTADEANLLMNNKRKTQSNSSSSVVSQKRSSPDTTKKTRSRHPEKPDITYINMIAMAIKESPTGKLKLCEIYSYLTMRFEYCRGSYLGWKNAVRHNLSLNECFQKLPKCVGVGKPGKGNYWTIKEDFAHMFQDINSLGKRRRGYRAKTKVKSFNSTTNNFYPNSSFENAMDGGNGYTPQSYATYDFNGNGSLLSTYMDNWSTGSGNEALASVHSPSHSYGTAPSLPPAPLTQSLTASTTHGTLYPQCSNLNHYINTTSSSCPSHTMEHTCITPPLAHAMSSARYSMSSGASSALSASMTSASTTALTALPLSNHNTLEYGSSSLLNTYTYAGGSPSSPYSLDNNFKSICLTQMPAISPLSMHQQHTAAVASSMPSTPTPTPNSLTPSSSPLPATTSTNSSVSCLLLNSSALISRKPVFLSAITSTNASSTANDSAIAAISSSTPTSSLQHHHHHIHPYTHAHHMHHPHSHSHPHPHPHSHPHPHHHPHPHPHAPSHHVHYPQYSHSPHTQSTLHHQSTYPQHQHQQQQQQHQHQHQHQHQYQHQHQQQHQHHHQHHQLNVDTNASDYAYYEHERYERSLITYTPNNIYIKQMRI